mmetsp:Transcript_7104/g.14817  ORF Transcript_7104/g.14817 Transcript_7104/m.14817 type:complete len:83 (-) Transcript_7104:546-794(-)
MDHERCKSKYASSYLSSSLVDCWCGHSPRRYHGVILAMEKDYMALSLIFFAVLHHVVQRERNEDSENASIIKAANFLTKIPA